MTPRRYVRKLIAMAGACAAIAGVFPALSQADTPITAFSAVPSSTQAGGHPDLEVSFTVANRIDQIAANPCNCEDAKDATVQLPAGFIGNPHATPQCTLAEFSVDSCPIDSQVGIVNVEPSHLFPFNAALYNMVPAPGEAGLLAFKVFFVNAPQFTILNARTNSDYGLEAKNSSIVHGDYPVHEFREVLWGVPADPAHNPLRVDRHYTPGEETAYFGNLCDAEGNASTADPNTVVLPCELNLLTIPPVPSNSPLTPFLQSPTTCDSALSSSLTVLSYDGGITEASNPWPEMTGCDQLSFNPSLYAHPTTEQTDSASGIDLELNVPQQLSPSVPSPTELRAASVTLPTGFSINPNAADGKTVCTDAEARFGTKEEAHCPEYSKIGSLEIDSSALPGPLPGFVYLGTPLPGNRYRVFLVADGFATHIKLAGTVSADPANGQLTVSFKDLPQSPLTSFKLHLFGSERGLLATPDRCDTYSVSSTFTPWDASLAAETSLQFFTIDSGPAGSACPGARRPFTPGFSGASSRNRAGSASPFSVTFTRQDGDQNLTGVTVTNPPGFTAKLAGVAYCPEAAIAQLRDSQYSGLAELAAPACPSASQIGTVVAGAGAGNHPLYIPGKVYLAGPYRGAPLSLVAVVPAVSGPYDLGDIAVRAAISIDPLTGQVTTASDALPQILEGIPLRTRFIRVTLDRPDFARNPTNCAPLVGGGQMTGDEGGVASDKQHFQVADCASLPFGPKLGFKLEGGTKRTGHPALTATLTAKPGEANIARTVVTMPHSIELDSAHIKGPCTRVQYAAHACPRSSILGTAKAESPLIGKPLEGPVYLRSSSHELPDIVVDLRGQIEIELDGRIDSVHGRLRTSFESVPDVPVTKFTLMLAGGRKGLLVNSTNLCAGVQRAAVKMVGQNGARTKRRQGLQISCGKVRNRRGAHKRRRNRHGRALR